MNTQASNKLLFSDSMKDFWKEEVSIYIYVYIIINDVFNIGIYVCIYKGWDKTGLLFKKIKQKTSKNSSANFQVDLNRKELQG